MTFRLVSSIRGYGGYYVPRGFAKIAHATGQLTIDFGRLSQKRANAVATSIKRGYSSGKADTEQYAVYASVCEKFGLKHSKISSGITNWVAIPNNMRLEEFRERLLDVVEPMFQLTGEEFDRKKRTVSGYHQWRAQQVCGQQVIVFQRPKAVPMNVLGKGIQQLLGEPPFGPMCEAVDFVKNGGKIVLDFK